MAASASERPLIPQPPATVAALRQAVARIVPAALPAFTGELDQAADEARLGADLAPLQRFTTHWSVYVHIQRQPRLAARFRQLEDLAETGDTGDARRAAAEIGHMLDGARAALARGES